MERYNKYLVLKIADIEKYLSDEKQLKLDALVTCIRVGRLNDGKRDQEYVCVAADWPMHEQVWGMVEAFVDGKPNEIEQLTARITELEEENARLMKLDAKRKKQLSDFDDVIDDLNVAVSCINPVKDLKRAVANLKEQAAASQAYAEQLREALVVLNGVSDLGCSLVDEALALPSDTSALDAYVAEKVKAARK